MSNAIIFCCPIPPPVHGQSFISKHLIDCYSGKKLVINQNFEGQSKLIKIVNTIITSLKLLLILCTRRIDIVYFTCSRTFLGAMKDFWLLFFAGYIFNKKIITHLHGSDFKSFYYSQGNFTKKIFLKLYSKVNIGIVLSENMSEQFEMLNQIRIKVLHNFYDPVLDKGNDILDKKENRIVISYFSNIMYSKGIFVALDSLKPLLKKYPLIDFHIAGKFLGDDYMNDLEVENHFFDSIDMYKQIKYFGQVQGDEKKIFLMNSDIMIFPSFYKSEAFAVSILDAMRAGNIIITTKQGYHHSIIKSGNGIVINDANTNSLTNAIESLLIDWKNIENIKFNNIKEAKNNYSLSKFKLLFDDIIHNLDARPQ